MGSEGAASFISTGHLPDPVEVQRLVDQCHETFSADVSGTVSDVYPALSEMDPSGFGIALMSSEGREYTSGDVDVPFTIMSVAKPFVFALACQELGAAAVMSELGVDATGLPFNSAEAVERGPDGRTNPMVNAGAIACVGLLLEATGDHEATWSLIKSGLESFAGRSLDVDAKVRESAATTNHRNRALASLLHVRGRVIDPDGAVNLYTRTSCLSVTARDLATMGATLADGGVNPRSRESVLQADVASHTLAVMATSGMYERSGDWLVRVGLPAKSGIGGGIVTSAPGKGGMGTWSPLLDPAGNSVRGVLTAERLSRALGLDLFASPVSESAQI